MCLNPQLHALLAILEFHHAELGTAFQWLYGDSAEEYVQTYCRSRVYEGCTPAKTS